VVIVAVAVVVLFAVFVSGHKKATKSGNFQVGQPATGAVAPPIRLASTRGGTFDLSAYRDKTVLLYFQEGIGCEPCWNQIRDLERSAAKVKALGVDQLVSITSDGLSSLRQKVTDEALSTPVLSDPDLAVSKAYTANQYGMMGDSRDGHTFIVVGPDGRIRWRADYGGPPDFTMYVPVDRLVSEIRTGMHQ